MRKIMITLFCLVAILAFVILLFIHQRSFGRLPQGTRFERIEQSPNWRNGAFQNIDPTVVMTFDNNRFRAMWKFAFGDKTDLRPKKPIDVLKTDLRSLPADKNFLVWFGHSSYLMQIDGKRFLIDPVFYKASPVSFVNKPFAGTEIYKPQDMPDIDFLIITHDHWDHLDYQTVMELKDKTANVVCPLGVGAHFEYWGFAPEKIVELDWNMHASLWTGLQIYCLPARHFSGRGLKSNQTLWASFMLQSNDFNVFISGDGGYGSHFKKIGRQFSKINLAILENGQYNPDWKDIHTMPEYLKQEVSDLNAEQILTVHNSKYALAHHPWNEPLKNAETLASEMAPGTVLLPKIGEVVWLH